MIASQPFIDWQKTARYGLSALVMAALPPLLLKLPAPWIGSTYGADFHLYELLGLSGALFLLFNLYFDLRPLRSERWQKWLPVLAQTLVGLAVLFTLTDAPVKAWDYGCYEKAAQALLAGQNPYAGCYVYPPLVVQALVVLQQTVSGLAGGLRGAPLAAATAWELVYYLFQCTQLLLVLIGFNLVLLLARRLLLPEHWAVGITTLLFLVNIPLQRTLIHNQVNLWMLDLALLALLVVEGSPLWGGVLAALGGHIKLYPLLLGLPWAVQKRWRALGGITVGLAVGVGLSALLPGGLGTWAQFVAFVSQPHRGVTLRDNGLHAIWYNVLRLFGDLNPAILSGGYYLLTLAAFGWLVYRLWQRRGMTGSQRVLADGADWLAASLLLSPLVWEHHYLMAIPLFLLAAAQRGREHPWLVALSGLLMFALPPVDVVLLGWHQLAGLVLALVLTRPRRLREVPSEVE